MKPVLLALGLFLAFLLARSTLSVSAQQVFHKPRTARDAAPDMRSRRVAALEAQEQALAMRQHEIELELDLTLESQRRVQNQVEREIAAPDAAENPSTLAELSLSRLQILQKKAELRQELDRVLAERQRVQEDWRSLTGLHVASR